MLLLIILPVLLLVSCGRTKTEYYPDGTRKVELKYRYGKLEGPSRWYNKNGQLWYEYYYHKGKLEGMSRRWFANGNKQLEENYREDRKEGLSRHWNESGVLILEAHYRNDTLHGSYIEFYGSRRPMIEGSYDMGRFDGTWKYYHADGYQTGEGRFVKGTGIQKAWYENGRDMRETPFVNGLREGKETRWDRSGKVEQVVWYKQGQVVRNGVK